MLGMIGRPGGRKIRAMRIAEQQRRMPEGTRQRARQEAADRLLSNDSGEIPLSEYQRTGDPRAGAKEQVEATARGRGKGLLAERQQEALGESFGQALGLENPGGRLDPTFMGKARDKSSGIGLAIYWTIFSRINRLRRAGPVQGGE